jgi:UDP-GlcNAc:undecaprenyl-phosphate GlcNAc-1-phosphate transferase
MYPAPRIKRPPTRGSVRKAPQAQGGAGAFRYNRAMSFTDTVRALFEDGTVIWGFLTAAAIVLVLTPLTARLGHRVGALDHPGDRPRVHSEAVPRIGGLAIAVGFLVPALLFVRLDGVLLGIVLATPLVVALGLYDDVRGLRPGLKLVGVMLIALIPVVGFGMKLDHVTLPLIGDGDLGDLAIPVTILWIALVANLVNLIDGMDALAAGIVAIACIAFALLAVSFERMRVAALVAIAGGAALGFLWHNYHPAKIFMGDSGALTLGFVVGCLAVPGVFRSAATIALAAPLLVMAVPILDTSFVVLKRLKYRRAPWGADQNHFYHRFLRIGFSQRRTAAYLHLWAALLALFAILVRFVPPRPQGAWDPGNAAIVGAAGLLVVAASVWMVYTLEILKARHFQALGFRRPSPAEEAEDHEEAVERVLTAGRH